MKRARQISKKQKRNAGGKGRTAAFFDVDGTLVKLTTDLQIFNHLFRLGEFPLWSLIKAYYFVLLHKLDLLKIEQTLEFMGFLKGRTTKELEKVSHDIFMKVIKPRIIKSMISEVKRHQKQGDMTVLLSNSPEEIIDSFREYLKIDYTVGTILEAKNGIYTGRVTRFCYSKVKKQVMQQFAREHDVDLSKSYFYTDSYSDLPTLLAVGNRIVVNPDLRLRMYAHKQGWRIIEADHGRS